MNKVPKTRIILSSGILTTMFLGALGWAFAEIVKIAPLEKDLEHVKKTSSNIEQKIDDIHWYLIRQKRVKVERDGTDSNR